MLLSLFLAAGLSSSEDLSMPLIASLASGGRAWGESVASAVKAAGGVITTAPSTGVFHTFTSSGTFTPSVNISNAQILLVGAGSGGANNNFPGTGGAAGNVVLATAQTFSSGSSYTITVGIGGTAPTTINTNGGNGSPTSVSGTGISQTAAAGTMAGLFIGTSGAGFTSTNGSGGAGAGANGGTTAGGNGSTAGDALTKALVAAGGTVYGDIQGGVYYYGGGGGSGNNGVGGFGGGGHGTITSGSVAGSTAPNLNSGSGGGGGSNVAPGGSTPGANGLVIIYYN